jgi:hypothetical protein
MNTLQSLIRPSILATSSLALFTLSACSEKTRFQTAAPDAPVKLSTSAPAGEPGPTGSPITPAAVGSPSLVGPGAAEPGNPAKWSDLKELTYDLRARFYAGFPAVKTAVDAQIAELVAKRATMTPPTDTRDWDFAMKEMDNSRDHLRATGEQMDTADVQNWEQRIDRVGLAWQRTQDAAAKVRGSTTN